MKFKFWRTWDDQQKASAIKAVGVITGLFALFSLVASLSYLFTWKQDQSLLTDPGMLDKAVDVANLGGKLGLKWADTLVGDWFGWGSFALIILLFAISARLIAISRRSSQVSPMPMMPPEQTYIPSSFTIFRVSSFCS